MERVKQLFAGMRARDVAFMGGYALYLAFGYMSFKSPTVLTSLGEAGHLVQSVFLIAVIVARFAVYGTMVVLARRTGRLASMAAFVVTAATAAVGFVVTRMAFQFAGFVPLGSLVPYLVFGGVCFGAGDALINLMWARFSGTLGLRKVYVFVLMSNMLSLVVYFLVTLAPTPFMLPLGAALFFVSVVCAKRSLDLRAPISEEYSAPVFKGTLANLWRPVLGTAILAFMSGLMLQLSARQDIPLETFQTTSLVTQAVLMAALFLPVLLVKKQPNLGAVYKVALPL